jgi:hypothetical protein
MSIAHGQTLVLPLHPLFRTSSDRDGNFGGGGPDKDECGKEVRPTELQYWVTAKGKSTLKAPYNADIWSVPGSEH